MILRRQLDESPASFRGAGHHQGARGVGGPRRPVPGARRGPRGTAGHAVVPPELPAPERRRAEPAGGRGAVAHEKRPAGGQERAPFFVPPCFCGSETRNPCRNL